MQSVNNYFFTISLPSIFYATLCFIVGILLHACAGIISSVLIVTLSVLLGWALYYYTKKIWTPLCLQFLCAGILLHHQQLQNQYNFLNSIHNKPISITGIIHDIFHDQQFPHQTRITLEAQEISTVNNGMLTTGLPTHLFVYTNHSPLFLIDDTISISACVIKNTPHDDFTNYLIKEGIAGTTFVDNKKMSMLQRPNYSLKRLVAHHKQETLGLLQKKMSKRGFAFFSSLFLGNKKINKTEMNTIKHDFRRWGISHYLARSGLHMIIFVCVWQLIFLLLPVGFLYKNFLMIILASVYALLSTPSISFNRAFLAFLIYALCTVSTKQSHAITIISLVTLILLILNPIALYFLDFQLSFGLAFLLAWLNQVRLQKRISSA